MNHDERTFGQRMVGKMPDHAFRSIAARNKGQAALVRAGIDAEAAQTVEVDLYRMPPVAANHGITVREAAVVEPAKFAGRRDREFRAQQTAQPDPPVVLGEIDDQVVVARFQGGDQRAFRADLPRQAEVLPFAIDGEQLRDIGVAAEHLLGVPVNQRVHFGVRHMSLEAGEDRRGQQNIAEMTQFDDEYATQIGERRRIIGFRRPAGCNAHAGTLTKSIRFLRRASTARISAVILCAKDVDRHTPALTDIRRRSTPTRDASRRQGSGQSV